MGKSYTTTTISDDRIGASDYGTILNISGQLGSDNIINLTDGGAVFGALQLVDKNSAQFASSLGNVYEQSLTSSADLTDKTLAALADLTGENTAGGQNKLFVWLALGALAAVAYILTHRKS